MDQAPREISFSGCRAVVWDELRAVQTHFPDGSYAPGAPEDTDAYRATCRRLGYPDDADGRWDQCREHELLHSLVSERVLFRSYSETLWRVAHRLERPEPVNTEEPVVFAFQRALRGFVASQLLLDLCGGESRFLALLDEARALVRRPDPTRPAAGVPTTGGTV